MLNLSTAAKAYATAFLTSEGAATSRNNAGCQFVAIGYLAGMTLRELNSHAKDAGGYTEAQWNGARVTLSRAWRAVAGEFGLGETLATAWARGDFNVSLMAAYEASAPPRKVSDRVAKAVKLLSALTSEEYAEVIRRASEVRKEIDAAATERGKRAEAIYLQLVG